MSPPTTVFILQLFKHLQAIIEPQYLTGHYSKLSPGHYGYRHIQYALAAIRRVYYHLIAGKYRTRWHNAIVPVGGYIVVATAGENVYLRDIIV